MRYIYTFIIVSYSLVVKLSALFGNKKAKLWVDGRRNLFEKYRKIFNNEKPNTFLWVHVSSLGEFEQGRPVIEAIKEKNPEQKILLTFFSPSGYEIRKNYPKVDVVLYLPIDTLSNMRKYLKLVSPSGVIFVKYDFWFNFLKVCFDNKTPVYFISSIFRRSQYFFKWWGVWFLKNLKKVDGFFVQNQQSLELLKSKGFKNVFFSGDTRLDRVIALKNENKIFPEIENLINGKKVLIAGSTWPNDEKILMPWIKENKDMFLIIAPHDISSSRIKDIENGFKEKVIKYSQINKDNNEEDRILIIDSIGILAYLYTYADIVYIGNGFGKGIHNILEPIVFGKPVIFGPNYKKFYEAVDLCAQKGVFSIIGGEEFDIAANKLLNNRDLYECAKYECLKYIEEQKGATEKIISEIKFST